MRLSVLVLNKVSLSPHYRRISSIPFFKHILKLCTFSPQVEGVRFVLGRVTLLPLQILPLRLVKHDACKALSEMRMILPAVAPIWLTR